MSVYAADRDSVRLLIALTACFSIEVKHIDLSSDFLHEDCNGLEPLYFEPVPTMDGVSTRPGMVALVVKNIYGNPNKPCIFTDSMRRHQQEPGYIELQNDHNIYVKRRPGEILLMAVTIDDFSAASNLQSLYQELLATLSLKYREKDLGREAHMLGWSISRDKNNGAFHRSQPYLTQIYIDLLRMRDANTAKTSDLSGIKLHQRKHHEPILDTKRFPYARAVEILRYLGDSTRQEIAYVVKMLARSTH